jgi:ABC-type antimicrobial peptide transport system permease subunit
MGRYLKILDYTLSGLLRKKYKSLALVAVYAFTIAVLGSVLFLTHGLKSEAVGALEAAPDIVVQRIIAGRHDLIPVSYAATIREFPGVKAVSPRVWGYYYDSLIKANLTLIGVGRHDLNELTLLDGRLPDGADECAVGMGVVSSFGPGRGDILALENSAGFTREYRITGVFKAESNLLTNDLVVMRESALRDFFAIDPDVATDLAVEVYNRREVKTLAKKIKYHLAGTRPISRDEILHTYESMFNWRSGMMLAVAVSALIAFCILAWDKATGVSAEEKREIALLKALGWETSDVLISKFWEGLVISSSSFLLGTIAAWIHVFFLGAPVLAPLLKGWSVLYPDFLLDPVVDLYQLFVLAVLTIVPYLACTLVPAWKTAVTDPEQALRG